MAVANEAEGWAEALRRIAVCRETRAEELDLGGLRLTGIPQELYELGWLKRLYLGADAGARKWLHLDEKRHNALGTLPCTLCTALTKLQLLDLAHNGLRALPGEFAALTNLTSLDLRGNLIGHDGARALAALTNLTSLDLWNNGIGDDGARALRALSGLTSLKLSSNQISDDGARAVAALTSLASLALGDNRIGDDGARELAALNSLTSLDLANSYFFARSNNIGADGARALAALVNLTSLDLGYNNIGDDGARALAPLNGLSSLVLSGNRISAHGVRALRRLSNLTRLDLSKNSFGADGARALAALGNLTSLDLWDCGIGDDGARALAALGNLASLGLHSNNIRADGARELAALGNLTVLDLGYNDIGDDGARGLAPLAKLTWLALRNNGIGEEGAQALAALTCLTSLDLSGNKIGDDGARALAALSCLTSLELGENNIGDDGARGLAALVNLTSLDLAVNEIGDEGARGLAAIVSLTSLRLDDNDIGPDGARALAALTGLTSLGLANSDYYGGTNSIGDNGAKALAALGNLTSLNLGSNDIGDDGAHALATLVNLTELHLGENYIGDDGARTLAALARLTRLTLDDNDIEDAGLRALAALTSLKDLDLSGNGITSVTVLRAMAGLQDLRLNRCRLVSDLAPICDMPSLKRLNLANSSVRGLDSVLLSTGNYENCLPRLRAHFADLRATASAGEGGGHAVGDVKFMILGNGHAGKTQIVRRLKGEPFDPTVPSTHGIRIGEARLATEAGELPVVLRIWDFGGQDIYHGSHALFLKSRAVFPIVWSADTTDKEEHERHGYRWRNYPLAYWLAYVKHLGGRQSPVLVVQAKVDKPADRRPLPLADDWAEGLDWHDEVTSSAAERRGMNILREKVIDAVLWLRDTQGVMRVGAGRAAVKAEIERRQAAGQRLMPRAEFDALCDATGGISSKEFLLEFLHNIGAVFYRQGLFGDQLILNQAWALDAVYAVFDRERSYQQLKGNGGRFNRSLLGALVWDADKHSVEDQEQFIQFMRASGMCFQLRGASAGFEADYIAPDLLPEWAHPDVQERLAWFDPDRVDASGKIAFALLPQGLLRTVMAAVGEQAGRAGTYWRDGFAFFEETTRARVLVEQAWGKDWSGEIAVSCIGGDAAKLLERTLELIDRQVERFGAKPTSRSTSLDRTREAASLEIPRESHDRERRDPAADLKPAFAPTAEPELYVSYAWGDATPEGVLREKTVDDFCEAAEAREIRIIRDKTAMQNGDEIPKFMDRLVQAEQVFVFLSDKYLKSPYCMHELFGVWRECSERGDRFRERTRFCILSSAQIFLDAGIDIYTAHWAKEADALKAKIAQALSVTSQRAPALARYDRMLRFQRYAAETEHVLEFIRTLKLATDLDAFIADALRNLPGRSRVALV